MAATRYLTKSRFKLAMECPTKLFYTSKKDIYYDHKVDNDFLLALAEGGFQVGELAKLYYPGGVNIEELDHQIALGITEELLKQEKIIIYEAAFCYKDLFIRADIIIKDGNKIELIEVKAKSVDPTKQNPFTTNKGLIQAKWKPYLFDVAFQTYVIEKSHPEYTISSNLLLSDKSKRTSVDGLNQMFFIYQVDGRYKVKIPEGDIPELGEKILVKIPVNEVVQMIYKGLDEVLPFENSIELYSKKYGLDEFIQPILGIQCGKCEFIAGEMEISNGYRSGFQECWRTTGLTDEELKKPLLLSLWDFRKKPEYIGSGKYFLHDLTREDLESKTKSKKETAPGLSRIDRQEMQIIKATNNDLTDYLDIGSMKNEIAKWKFPLHFIDFETSAVAIPFNKGRRPYEQIAFQFSHHIVNADGTIEHCGQWLSEEIGAFPNFHFVRELKKQLTNDDGTIFRYAAHENTILNTIYNQLSESAEPDRLELCDWIKTITKSTETSVIQWQGDRNMVDMREMVLRYYYNPLTGGSNSIKHVLPAILSSSNFLQKKYSVPVYGNEIPSKNFKDHTWITRDKSGNIINPYLLLPPIHNEISNELLDEYLLDEEIGIADGGAAMIGFTRMQFSEMGDEERTRIRKALLRYCELDTFAMVMIWEAWKDWCK
jgi:hypothetical protein